jgi:drug/metabolite transporter (DMT)-like permease
LLAFATLYVVWGSTYLAIRFAVAAWPPFLMASVRFALAGVILYGFLRLRGEPAPAPRAWRAALIVGGLLLGIGNGLVCWAEQWVPSGITALIVASVPLWTAVLPWVFRRGPAPRGRVLVGVALGMAGVGLLLGGGQAAQGTTSLLGPFALVVASIAWSVGSLWSRRLPLPASPFMATAMEMLAASPLLLGASALRGELGTLSAAALAPVPLAALAYLVVLGSIAGFGSYIFLLNHTTPARATTYAFVNPLIAVLLGRVLGNEPIGLRTLLAAPLIVLSVVAVVTAPRTPT